ncbi:MAG: glycosyltransferase [Sphingomonadales bacterium]
MKITIGLLAKNEEKRIGATIASLSSQSIFSAGHSVSIIVVPNACTDNTAKVAQDAFDRHFGNSDAIFQVVETPNPGKSRAWNQLVHDIAPPDTDFFVFVDADIAFAYDDAIIDMFSVLDAHPETRVCAGWPRKDVSKKTKKTWIDRFSLTVSEQGGYEHAICGQLYVARGDALRTIWLPVPTPGEDGFLNAMVQTNGFSEPAIPVRVRRAPRVTHFFEAISIAEYFKHERRMIVGTAINTWMFEHFMALERTEPVGSKIRSLNESDHGWVQQVVTTRTAGKLWTLPPKLLTWRLDNLRNSNWTSFFRRVPFSVAATLLNIVPALSANVTLRRKGSGSIW